MQGVLAEAKNGDEVFWEEKFHAANGKAKACTQGALLFFFSFMFWGGWGGGNFFFSFFPDSECVCTMFPSSSYYVSQFCNVFLFLHTTSLLSHIPWKMASSFHLYRWAKGEELYTSKIEPSVLGSHHSFIYFE